MNSNGEDVFEYIDGDGDRIVVRAYPEFLIFASRDSSADEEEDACVRLDRDQVQDLRDALNEWLEAPQPKGDKEPETESTPAPITPIPPELLRPTLLHLLRNDAEVYGEVTHNLIGSLDADPDVRQRVRDTARTEIRRMFNLANNEIQGGDTQR